MRILHLNTFDTQGGAARGAYWLHQALVRSGVDSQMLVARKYSHDNHVIGPSSNVERGLGMMRPILDDLPLRFYPKKDPAIFSPAWIGGGIRRQIEKAAPDVVHLHWVCNGFLRPETVPKIQRPVVWTLRDMWAFTGGCHYDQGCGKYEKTCGGCPHLGSDREGDLSRWIWGRKKKAWDRSRFQIVTISHWLAKCAEKSSLFRGKRIEVIHNALDAERFKPMGQEVARKVLGLPQDKKLILFGAISPTRDQRKGFQHLEKALRKLAQTEWKSQVEVVIFGDADPSQRLDIGMKGHFLGHLNDDTTLALAYSAADVMVVPSEQEAFGKTAMESLACGTPVVSFNNSALPEIVEHERNGYCAQSFDSDDLAHGIQWVISGPDRWQKMSKRAREKVEQEFTLEIQARKYKRLYEEVLTKGRN